MSILINDIDLKIIRADNSKFTKSACSIEFTEMSPFFLEDGKVTTKTIRQASHGDLPTNLDFRVEVVTIKSRYSKDTYLLKICVTPEGLNVYKKHQHKEDVIFTMIIAGCMILVSLLIGVIVAILALAIESIFSIDCNLVKAFFWGCIPSLLVSGIVTYYAYKRIKNPYSF